MSQDLYRKYIDIINENSQPKVQLDEGIMDTIKSLVPKAMKLLGGDTIAQIAQQVKQVTGGDFTPSKENAIKVAKALGFDKMVGGKEGQTQQQVAEGWGIAGNWQGKLLQLIHLAGIGGAGYAAMNPSMGDATGFGYEILMTVGLLLLMFANTFWSTDRGMVGSMGRHGNQGFDTSKGPSGRMPGDL